MKFGIKVGDRIRLLPFEEAHYEDSDNVYGIPNHIYKEFEKNPPKVVTITEGEDTYFSIGIIDSAGNNWLISENYITEVIPAEPSSSVNHPSHYNQGGMEVWDVIKAFTSNLSGAEAFYAGNAIKYILRWDKKNGIEDLEKAKVYIDKIIEGRKEK